MIGALRAGSRRLRAPAACCTLLLLPPGAFPSDAWDRARPGSGPLFPVPRSRFPLWLRLMLTGGLALGATMMAAGVWISRPIPKSTLSPNGGSVTF